MLPARLNDETSIATSRISVTDVTNGVNVRDAKSSYREKTFPFASDNTIRFKKFDERGLARNNSLSSE